MVTKKKTLQQAFSLVFGVSKLVVILITAISLFLPKELRVADEWYTITLWWWICITVLIMHLIMLCCFGSTASAVQDSKRRLYTMLQPLKGFACCMSILGIVQCVLWLVLAFFLVSNGFKSYTIEDLEQPWEDNVLTDSYLYCEFWVDFTCSGWVTRFCPPGCPQCGDDLRVREPCGNAMIDDIETAWKRLGILGIATAVLSIAGLGRQYLSIQSTLQFFQKHSPAPPDLPTEIPDAFSGYTTQGEGVVVGIPLEYHGPVPPELVAPIAPTSTPRALHPSPMSDSDVEDSTVASPTLLLPLVPFATPRVMEHQNLSVQTMEIGPDLTDGVPSQATVQSTGTITNPFQHLQLRAMDDTASSSGWEHAHYNTNSSGASGFLHNTYVSDGPRL
eukprot:TRINITY_DN17433_c0_g1_i1.p1 TRINITY_DN17433_c0_g1~~TRINITY_DN17433_c0_g1_i1.p1  ORF type:complete len:390 (-),score=13.20 TRINITY_DN17433_c0_g1_i1:201-1370(-)